MPIAPPDSPAFVRLFDLEHATLRDARAAKQNPVAAEQAIHEALGAHALSGYLTQHEAAELGRQIAADDPGAVTHQRHLVELADAHSKAKPHKAIAGRAEFLEEVDFGHEAAQYARRGRGWYVCGQLCALTGDTQWAERAAKLLDQPPSLPPFGPEDEDGFLPILPWHPNFAGGSALDIAHVVQNMGVALPMLWPHWDAATRRKALAYLAHQAEGFYRGYRKDPYYNIPFHGLVAMLGVASLFPQLRGAAKWKAHMDTLFAPGGPYVAPGIMVQDGFYGEGLGYQQVNTFLLLRCFMLYARNFDKQVPTGLRHEVERGLELAANTLRPDGSSFLIGDHSARCAHEHEIEYHEILHLGAALLEKPGLKLRAGACRGANPPSLLKFLMGRDGYARWKAMPAPDLASREHRSWANETAGLFHLKGGRGVEASCHGLLNVSISANHGHHDVNAVAIFGKGRELVSDSGRLSYTAEGNALQQAPNAHAALRLGHLMPRGPRHATTRAATRKLFAQSADGRLHIAIGEHTLIEDHIHRRALILLQPGELGDGLWLVWDRLTHAETQDGAEPPIGNLPAPPRVFETTFPLHAPGSDASVAGLDGWSNHRPADRLKSFKGGEEIALTCAEAFEAEEQSESEANIQIAALPELAAGASIGLEAFGGFYAMTDLTVARPVLSFKGRGYLPYETAFVLLPFAGLAQNPPWKVTGWCGNRGRSGAFEARVEAVAPEERKRFPQPIVVTAENLHASSGQAAKLALLAGGKEIASLGRVTL